jgi:hypothetical protein
MKNSFAANQADEEGRDCFRVAACRLILVPGDAETPSEPADRGSIRGDPDDV